MGLHKRQGFSDQQRMLMWIIPAVMIACSVLIAMSGDIGREVLRYDRVWIGQGELWRLFSGHFAHLSVSHLVLNSAGLLLVWYLIGDTYSARDWLLIIVSTLMSIDLAFWFLSPSLYWYVGMSGLLHGLLAAGIVARLRSLDGETVLLLLLLTAKIAWEQYAGPVPGSEATSGGPVVVDAHLYGALGGILGALIASNRVVPRAAI